MSIRSRYPTEAKSYWLEGSSGRLAIGAWAVLIGRNPDCNFVIDSAEVSRHHALVRVGAAGPELLPLGRHPVRVNGADRSTLTPLRDGDRIDVGPWEFTIIEHVSVVEQHDERAWFIERSPGLMNKISGAVFRVGGGDDDDLVIPSWEPGVLEVRSRGEACLLRALRPGVRCERDLTPGEETVINELAQVFYGSDELTLRARTLKALDETCREERPRFAVLVLLEFQPRGGQLSVEIGGRLVTSHLSDRRCDLVACLLRPPPPYVAGEFIPEEVICQRVWPGEPSGRVEVNTLLYRLRQALIEDGIDPTPLFERRAGGLRFCLAPLARVVVR